MNETAFDPNTSLAFSSNGEGTLTVVQEASADSFLVRENATTQVGARTMALDEKTHRVFVMTAEYGPLPEATADQPRPRRPMVPGSFVLLVLVSSETDQRDTKPGAETVASLREISTDSLRYWEPRRVAYNLILIGVTVGQCIAAVPAARSRFTFDAVLGLFILAVIANLLYSAAYVADLFVQLSGFRARWLGSRWALFAVGTVFATVLAHFGTRSVFSVHP